MKQLILIKLSNTIQLAHLYEHIFCRHIDSFFYEHNLFPHLDYSLVGRTFYKGVIYINLELYTDSAISLAVQISSLTIKLNKTIISTAASQLLAEKEEPYSSLGYDKVKQALNNLQKQPWQNVDNIELIDIQGVRRKANPFYITEGKPLPARKLTTTILLGTEFVMSHRQLLPLFRQFAWLINTTLQSVLANKYGYYSLTDIYRNKPTVGLSNIFKVADAHDVDVDLADNLATCMEVIKDLRQHNAFTRYMDELSVTSYYNHPYSAPNLERNYEDTLIFIGPKGWQKIATIGNCELLLKHMSIEVKFGRSRRASQSLIN